MNTACIRIDLLNVLVCAGGQSRGGGYKGGLEEESEQDLNGEPSHGDRNPENCSPSAYSPVEGLSG